MVEHNLSEIEKQLLEIFDETKSGWADTFLIIMEKYKVKDKTFHDVYKGITIETKNITKDVFEPNAMISVYFFENEKKSIKNSYVDCFFKLHLIENKNDNLLLKIELYDEANNKYIELAKIKVKDIELINIELT
jgi:hypothetical protein